MSNQTLKKTIIGLVALTALAVGITIGIYQRPTGVVDFEHTTVLSAPRSIGPFKLTAHNSSEFNRDSFKGKWTFMFFGYTHCPDICPNTMTVFNIMDKGLQENPALRSKTDFVMVSVDPDRDTVDVMAEYVPYFNPRFIGLTETQKGHLLALSSQLGIVYLVRKPQAKDDKYIVDHSPAIILVNPKGQFHAVFSAPHDPAGMLDDYRVLSKQYEERS